MSEKPFRFTAHVILADGTLYPHLTPLGEEYAPKFDGVLLVGSLDQGEEEDFDDFCIGVTAQMEVSARRHGWKFSDDLLPTAFRKRLEKGLARLPTVPFPAN